MKMMENKMMEKKNNWSASFWDENCEVQFVVEQDEDLKYIISQYDLEFVPYEFQEEECDMDDGEYQVKSDIPQETLVVWIDPEKEKDFRMFIENDAQDYGIRGFHECLPEYGSTNHKGPSLYWREMKTSFYAWGSSNNFCQRIGRTAH